jgi:hypothetical protein
MSDDSLRFAGVRSLARTWLKFIGRTAKPVAWGQFRRIDPLNRTYGAERGTPIDRYYIEGFLRRESGAVRGRVLEVGDSRYTRRFGGDAVADSDVLHATHDNPKATLVGDLETGLNVPRNSYDCLILTQVFPFIFRTADAVRHSFDALRPGGVMLATLPGLTQISRYDDDLWGDYWRFTSSGSRKLFGDVFGAANVMVEEWGNVLTATALLHGLAAEDLDAAELDHRDPDYPVLVTVRAQRSF